MSLHDWQRQVLEALASNTRRDEVTALASDAAAGTDLGEWVASWDPDLVDLATLLVSRWAARDEDVPGDAPSG